MATGTTRISLKPRPLEPSFDSAALPPRRSRTGERARAHGVHALPVRSGVTRARISGLIAAAHRQIEVSANARARDAERRCVGSATQLAGHVGAVFVRATGAASKPTAGRRAAGDGRASPLAVSLKN